jgi:hypothetical protein
MRWYRAREGAITAVDTKSQLTTLGSETAPGPQLVPGAAKFLKEIIVSFANDMAVAADGTYLVRLEGPGLPNGQVVLPIGGAGVAVATGGHGSVPAVKIPIGVEVKGNQEILVFAENAGEDLGSSEVLVGLVFADDLKGEAQTKGTICVEGDVNAIDSRTGLTAQGSVSAPSRITPADATKIERIVVATGNDGLAAGAGNMFLRLNGAAIKGGEQIIPIGGHCSQTVQSGSDAAPSLFAAVVLNDIDIAVDPSENIDVSVELTGVDVGDTSVAVGIVFA